MMLEAPAIPEDSWGIGCLDSEVVNLGSARVFAEDIVEIIGKATLYADFTSREIEIMCRYMACFGVPRNVDLLKEGASESHMLLVLTGEVARLDRDSRGAERRVGGLGPGTWLGADSALDEIPRPATFRTVVPTDIAVLGREQLQKLVAAHPRLGNKLLLAMLRSVGENPTYAPDRKSGRPGSGQSHGFRHF